MVSKLAVNRSPVMQVESSSLSLPTIFKRKAALDRGGS